MITNRGQINSTLAAYVVSKYRAQFHAEPELILVAPGRINLIGEHTDYNMGYVLPGAVQYGIYFALGRNHRSRHEWVALDKADYAVIEPRDFEKNHGGWIDYLLGAWLKLGEEHPNLPQFNCVFAADLPEGAGLSSSSALTCGMLFGMQSLLGLDIPSDQIAQMSHQVERNYVGLRGGMMDQHTCMLAQAGHFLLLDCRDRSYEQIPFDAAAVSLFLINTNVKHNLTETDYNTRADECARAVQILQEQYPIHSLRDVELAQIDAMKEALGPVLYRRARFVLEENARVLRTVKCLRQNDWKAVGDNLYASHRGLQNVYEVSCPELDFLVDLTRWEDWILGARMMGGGFGGCIIALGNRPPDPFFERQVEEQYFLAFGLHPTFINVTLSGGARILAL